MDISARETLHVFCDVPKRADGLSGEVCMVVDDGRDLLVTAKVGYPSGCIRLPTGGVLEGEAPLHAATREAEEELGLIASFAALGRITYARPDATVFTSWIVRAQVDVFDAFAPAQRELSEIRVLPISSLLAMAASLEALPATPHRGMTWEQWGRFRAIAHRFTDRLLAS